MGGNGEKIFGTKTVVTLQNHGPMSIHNQMIRVSDDDPRRCQSGNDRGQCIFQAFEGSKYCPMHSRAPKDDARAIYRLNSFKMKDPNSPQLKSLREEIGILRAMLETRINACKDDVDLMLNAPIINSTINNIAQLVAACHKLEKDLGKYVDIVQLSEYSQLIITAISDVVTDPAALTQIAENIFKVTETFTNAAGLPLAKLRDGERIDA